MLEIIVANLIDMAIFLAYVAVIGGGIYAILRSARK